MLDVKEEKKERANTDSFKKKREERTKKAHDFCGV